MNAWITEKESKLYSEISESTNTKELIEDKYDTSLLFSISLLTTGLIQ